jgi:hypothetical protein
MNRLFARHLTIVAAIHGFLLLCLMFGAWLSGCFHRSSTNATPITFEVDVRPLGKEEKRGLPEPGGGLVQDDHEKAPVIKLAPKKADEKKAPKKSDQKKDEKKTDKTDKTGKEPAQKTGEKKAIKIGKLVTRPGRGQGAGPDYGQAPGQKGGTTLHPLSQAEIARLLALGGKASDQNIIPGQFDMYRLMVRNTLYEAWFPPDKDEAGTAVATVRIWFGDGGQILKWKIEKASGVAALDASVEQVMNAVRAVPRLGSEFINQFRWKGYSIDFMVQ